MKYTVILMLLVGPLLNGWSQKIEEITHREINVHFSDSSIKADVLLAEKRTHLKNTANYYWYYNNAINSNQGGYKGRLLDGGYQVTTHAGNLITKGNFKKGNKSGEWKKWNDQGQLVYIEHWTKGVKNGKCQQYKDGKLREQGSYKKNKLHGHYFVYANEKLIEKRNYSMGVLHGKQITYDADTISNKISYKKGVPIIPKARSKKEDQGLDKTIKDSSTKKWWQLWKKSENSTKIKSAPERDSDNSKAKKEKKIRSKKREEKENKPTPKKDD